MGDLRIFSDGTIQGTKVFCDEQMVSGVSDVKLSASADTNLVSATITARCAHVDFSVDDKDINLIEIEDGLALDNVVIVHNNTEKGFRRSIDNEGRIVLEIVDV